MYTASEIVYFCIMYVSLYASTFLLQTIALTLIPECISFQSKIHTLLKVSYSLCGAYFFIYNPLHFAYIFFFSALYIVTITDINTMLISRWSSLYLVPTGWILSFYNLIPLSIYESIAASCIGFCFLWIINWIFYCIRKQNGIGQGDIDLIALIGSYTGFLGIWFGLLCGSVLGTLTLLTLIIFKKSSLHTICFGPFLCIATTLFLLFQPSIVARILL